MEENLTKGVCCVPICGSERLDSRECPAEGGIWTPRALPLLQPHSPEAQTCSLRAQFLSVPSALPLHRCLRIRLPSSELSCAVSPPLMPTQRASCSRWDARGRWWRKAALGWESGGVAPHRGGEQTLFCLQGQQRTVGIDTRPSASSEEGGSPGVTPAWGPASSRALSAPPGATHTHPLLPLRP